MKLNTFNAIKNTVLEDLKNLNVLIPNYVHKVVNLLQHSNLFLYYRTYKITKYINPRDAIITGGVLHSGAWVLGLSQYLKTAIYIKCTLNLLERYEKLHEACLAFTDSIKFRYPVYHTVNWQVEKIVGSPSMTIWWKTTIKSYQQQIIKVLKASIKIFVEIFKLGFYLRDLYLLTQNDPKIEFYACSELADDLNNHCANLEKNLRLLHEQFASQEALGNRLMQKMGMKTDMSSVINKLVTENPHVLSEISKQIKGAKEDIRRVVEAGVIDMSSGLHRPNCIKKCRFVPWLGQLEVEAKF